MVAIMMCTIKRDMLNMVSRQSAGECDSAPTATSTANTGIAETEKGDNRLEGVKMQTVWTIVFVDFDA